MKCEFFNLKIKKDQLIELVFFKIQHTINLKGD